MTHVDSWVVKQRYFNYMRYVASNNRITVNTKIKKMCKTAVVAYFKTLFQYLIGATVKSMETSVRKANFWEET